MSTLRPPSTSPSPSPAPGGLNGSHKASARASMGPASRPSPINLVNPPASPRPGSGRPTSELLSAGGMFQTPEAEAIDQWFENLQNYEATLEEMAAASLDVNFKEELSAIEQWFRVLSEAERTAALYSLLQHSTQVQIRFFITVLQQMARADPMTALLSPSVGGSMQNQMEAKLAQMGLKSPGPGIKQSVPASPSARTFGSAITNRQSLAVDSTSSSFLSPESANNVSNSAANDAAATLAQQRAKLKANAAHRISAPPLATSSGADRNVWGSGANALGQVAERPSSGDSPTQELTIPTPSNGTSRPKSMDFSTLANSLRSPRLSTGPDAEEAQLSPMVGGNWASMVNTPLVPMFDNNHGQGGGQNLDAAATKLANWQMGNSGGRFSLDDAKKFRRPSKTGTSENGQQSNVNNAVYGDDGNPMNPSGQGQQHLQQRNNRAGWSGGPPQGSSALRSPALSNVSSGRFGSDDGGFANAMNMNAALGQMGMGMPSPGMNGMGGLNGMNGLNGMAALAAAAQMGQLTPAALQQMQQMNMLGMANLGGMGLGPDAQAQLLAAQMAANGFALQPGMGPFGMAGGLGGMGGMGGMGGNGGGGMGNRTNRGPARMAGAGGGGSQAGGSGSRSNNGRSAGGGADGKEKEDEVDPTLLNDVPGWLRSLRLHKYTPNFEGMTWREMVAMDEAALEAKGVAALGARRKMLKTFETVRHKMGIDSPNGGGSPGGEKDE